MKLLIESDGTTRGTKIRDAETGDDLHKHLTAISFAADAASGSGLIHLSLSYQLVPVQIAVEADQVKQVYEALDGYRLIEQPGGRWECETPNGTFRVDNLQLGQERPALDLAPGQYTATELLALPKEQCSAILRAQAELMAPVYEAGLDEDGRPEAVD